MNKKENFILFAFITTITLFFFNPFASVYAENGKKIKDSENTLYDKKWELIEITGQPQIFPERFLKLPYFIFQTENMVSGYLGCNSFSAKYELQEPNHISFSEIGSTKIACADLFPENQFISVLTKTNNYQMNQDTLSLKEGDIILAKFKSKANDE